MEGSWTELRAKQTAQAWLQGVTGQAAGQSQSSWNQEPAGNSQPYSKSWCKGDLKVTKLRTTCYQERDITKIKCILWVGEKKDRTGGEPLLSSFALPVLTSNFQSCTCKRMIIRKQQRKRFEDLLPRQTARAFNRPYLLSFWTDKFLEPTDTDPRAGL